MCLAWFITLPSYYVDNYRIGSYPLKTQAKEGNVSHVSAFRVELLNALQSPGVEVRSWAGSPRRSSNLLEITSRLLKNPDIRMDLADGDA